jgi:hypothetical protein
MDARTNIIEGAPAVDAKANRPDAAELLEQNHGKLTGLFERYQAGERTVITQICPELIVPTRAARRAPTGPGDPVAG